MADPLINFPLPGALEIAFNRFLQADEDALAECAAMAGQVIAIKIRELKQPLYFIPHADGMQVLGKIAEDQNVKAQIEGGLFDFGRIALAEDKRDAALAGGLRIEGELRTAERLQKLFAQLDFDWEEQLAQVTGDVLAHQIGQGIRGLFGWGQRASKAAMEDTAVWLRDETEELVQPSEAQEFANNVDALRDDIARFEQRLQRFSNSKQV